MKLMQDLYPRLLGGLALVFAAVLQRGALDWPSDVLWALFAIGWLGSSIMLVIGRRTAIAAGVLAALSMLFFLGPGRHINDPLALLWWLGLAVAVSDRRPRERALLVRVTVTCVYAFACLSKLNPSFLSGEQLVALSIQRSQMNGFEELFRTNVGVGLAWLTVLVEGAMAIALWFRPTRVPAVVVGTVMAITFIVSAHHGTMWDVSFIIVLNLLLVVSYVAFFEPIGRVRLPWGHASPAPAGQVTVDETGVRS